MQRKFKLWQISSDKWYKLKWVSTSTWFYIMKHAIQQLNMRPITFSKLVWKSLGQELLTSLLYEADKNVFYTILRIQWIIMDLHPKTSVYIQKNSVCCPLLGTSRKEHAPLKSEHHRWPTGLWFDSKTQMHRMLLHLHSRTLQQSKLKHEWSNVTAPESKKIQKFQICIFLWIYDPVVTTIS